MVQFLREACKYAASILLLHFTDLTRGHHYARLVPFDQRHDYNTRYRQPFSRKSFPLLNDVSPDGQVTCDPNLEKKRPVEWADVTWGLSTAQWKKLIPRKFSPVKSAFMPRSFACNEERIEQGLQGSAMRHRRQVGWD